MKQVLSIFLALCLIAIGGFTFFEAQIMDAADTYQEFTVSQEVTGEISITDPATVTMDPAIAGLTGGVGTGTTTTIVTSTDTDGFNLYLSASSTYSNASLEKDASYYFSDYDLGGTGGNATTAPNFTWEVNAADSEFGYTVEGTDTASFFKDNGSICNLGSANADYKCWQNASTTNQVIGDRSSAATGGSTITIGFKAEVGSTRNQESGNYQATVGLTAVVK